MTAAKPLARYGAIERRARERLPNRPSYTIQWDTTPTAARAAVTVALGARLREWKACRRHSISMKGLCCPTDILAGDRA
jgi:hypothetical protein